MPWVTIDLYFNGAAPALAGLRIDPNELVDPVEDIDIPPHTPDDGSEEE